MYLRALEISGFKSFPERTRLTFERDITAIVGPNGSGKSNISDAILWVMGEQSSRTLRAGRGDIRSALEAYDKEYYNFTISDIEALTNVRIDRNKRNGRKQEQHLQFARGIRGVKANLGEHVSGGGRPSARERVHEWREQHPEGRKADCYRDTGLDPKTIRKWWEYQPSKVQFEDGHITVKVAPSQKMSDLLVEAFKDRP